MRVIVTRPAAQALSWVRRLGERGIEAAALPLIEIAAPLDASALQRAWHSLPTRRMVMFVSPSAAERFFAARPPGAAWPDGSTAAAPGPGTVQTLLALGVPLTSIVEPAADAPQFDSQALWHRIGRLDWSGASVLIVRGDGGRDWLAEQLAAQGATVETLGAYRRLPARFDAAASALLDEALRDPRRCLWCFSSSEAIGHLLQARPLAEWREAQALTTHPRIAERARGAGFGRVLACRPTLDAVVACIQSIAS